MRPSKSINDGIGVDFTSLFYRFLSPSNFDFLHPNYGLKMPLSRAEIDSEDRMRAP